MDHKNAAPVVEGLETVSPEEAATGLSRRQALGAMASAAFVAGMAALPLRRSRNGRAPSDRNEEAFVDKLIAQMTVDEKVGQLRLISIGPEMPFAKIVEEIAAGRIAGSFNTVVRRDNRPMQEAAVKRSRLKIPLFFAYDVVHGHRTTFDPARPGVELRRGRDRTPSASRRSRPAMTAST